VSQPTQTYTFVSDDEAPEAVAALAKLIGEAEANKPSWVRRLVKLGTGEIGAIVRTCCQIQRESLDWKSPWTVPNGLSAIEVAYPLAEAVGILQSTDSPEIELERRRSAFAVFQAEKAKREEEKRKAEEAAAARLVQDRLDEERFHARDWEAQYSDLGRTLIALSIMCAGRDSALSDDLRFLAEHQRVSLGNLTNQLPFPRVPWNKVPRTSSGWQWWLRNEPSKAST